MSRNADLSDPIETFEVGKQARFYCEDVRDAEKSGITIPAGTGMRDYQEMIVGSKSDYDRLVNNNDDAVEAESTVGTINS